MTILDKLDEVTEATTTRHQPRGILMTTRKVLTGFSWASDADSREETEFFLFHPGLIRALLPLDNPSGEAAWKALGVTSGTSCVPGGDDTTTVIPDSPADKFVKEYRARFPDTGRHIYFGSICLWEVNGPFTVITDDGAEVILEYNDQEWY